jgi:hypothetical protein
MRRSSLGGHYAGTGIESPTSKEFDDFKVERGRKVYRGGMFESDKFSDRKAFQKYCESQSGEVKIYNLNDEAPK